MKFERARDLFPTVDAFARRAGLPRHIAFIMDGNRRWAARRGAPALHGHRQGAEALRRVIDAAGAQGIAWLTFYVFSTENWNRSAQEVEAIMSLARSFSGSHLQDLHDKGVRLRVLGERDGLDAGLIERIGEAERLTGNNAGLQVALAFNYSGRYDIARAAREIARKAVAGEMRPDEITASGFGDHLATCGMPLPDLLIRTGGERRLSNFLLWESAYAELLFLDTLWPDFDAGGLRHAIEEFQRRILRADAYPNRAAGA